MCIYLGNLFEIEKTEVFQYFLLFISDKIIFYRTDDVLLHYYKAEITTFFEI